MNIFKKAARNFGGFLEKKVLPVAIGAAGSYLGLNPQQPEALAPPSQPAGGAARPGGLPFGLTPMTLALLAGGAILVVVLVTKK